MAYTEFYCDPANGSNLNAGSTTSGTALVTSVGGNWDNPSLTFTATDSPDLSGVTVGMFASVYVTVGATVATFVGRITAVDNTAKTVTLSTTAKGGAAPTTGTGTVTLRVGGAWKGPNGSSGFPFNFAAVAMNDGTNPPRVNLKNSATYNVTAAMAHSLSGAVTFQGYTTTPGDGGKATIDGGTASAGYIVLDLTGSYTRLLDIVFSRSGNSSPVGGGIVRVPGTAIRLNRVRFTGGLGIGCFLSGNGISLIECEVDNCNGFSTSFGAMYVSSAAGSAVTFLRCFAHDTTGGPGFGLGGGSCTLTECVSDANSSAGLLSTTTGVVVLERCAFTNNGGDGVKSAATAGPGVHVESCSFVNNTGFAVNASSTFPAGPLSLVTCGHFGNTAGTIGGTNQAAVQYGTSSTVDLVAYASTPFAGAGTGGVGSTRAGDFGTTLAAAKGTGRGAFPQASNYSTTTTSYPDRGPAQHLDSGGGSGAGGVSRSRVVGGV